MNYSLLPDHMNLARLLSEVAKLYPDAETLIGQEVLGLSPFDLCLARRRRIGADVVEVMERLERAIYLVSDRNGIRAAAPGILRHVPPEHLFRGVFSTLDYRLEDWREMEGASIFVPAEHVDKILRHVKRLQPGSAKASRPRRDDAREAIRALYPDGERRGDSLEIVRRKVADMATKGGVSQTFIKDELRRLKETKSRSKI